MLVALPAATAQEEPDNVNPYPYINAIPNPVTVNTPTLFHMGSVYPTRNPQPGWYDLTVEVTRPDDEIDIVGPATTDQTGGTGRQYTPTMVGTYIIRTHFPEQVKEFSDGRSGPIGTIMEDSYSEELELIVIEEQLEYYPAHALPSEYWTRPIDGQIRTWYKIAGNWLDYNRPTDAAPHSVIAPYNEDAPESAHILWAQSLTIGGLAGGVTGEHGFEQGDAYEPKLVDPVIIGGVLVYNLFEARGDEQTVVAKDLHTGEELWARELIDSDGNSHRLGFGQAFYWDSYNYHGVHDYLWATERSGDWHAFDPFTGRWIYTMEGVSSGTRVYGPKGELFLYNVNTNNGWMTLWNSSRVVSNAGSWRPQGNVYDAEDTADGIEWNVTIPELVDLPGRVYKVREGIILGTDFTRGSLADDPVTMWAISTEPGSEGDLLWDTTWSPPTPTISVEDANVEEDLFIVSTKESSQTYGFRLSTGEELWGPTPMRFFTDNWGHSSGNSWDIIADGKVIAGNYGGTVWCYDAQTGNVEWRFDIDDPYTEVLHNNRWRFRPTLVTDGKLYIENTEHNPRDPQPRGAPFICIDLEKGEEIWRIPYRAGEWSTTAIIADSILVIQSTYDQRFYAIGKGPSAITVEAPLLAATKSSSVTIRGTVTDVSPGTETAALQLRFPNGVPAVSDADMTEWMLYVYNQFERPEDATGVSVKLEAINPNGGYVDIGTAISDGSGNYGFTFEPDVEGKYMIMATFYGSEGYYGSTTTTYLTVDPAAEEGDLASLEGSVSNVEDSMSNLTTYIIAILALVIIALVIAVYSILKSSK